MKRPCVPFACMSYRDRCGFLGSASGRDPYNTPVRVNIGIWNAVALPQLSCAMRQKFPRAACDCDACDFQPRTLRRLPFQVAAAQVPVSTSS